MNASSQSAHRPILNWLFLMIFLFPLAGCEYLPFGFTSIKDIVNNPARYENREVKVRGVVLEVTKIPFLETKFYVLNEDGYQLTVSTTGTVPAADSEIIVTGTVENVAIIGKQSIGVHIREKKRAQSGLLTRLGR